MKSLYESILDDEDVLISGTKKHINNPFIQIANIIRRGSHDYRLFEDDLMSCLNKIKVPFDGEWEVSKDYIRFTLDSSKSKRKLKKIDCVVISISNIPVVRHTYKVPDNAEIVVAVVPSNSKDLSKVLKTLKIQSYDDKMNKMIEQYDLKLHDTKGNTFTKNKLYII